jgi:hypothetical protein
MKIYIILLVLVTIMWNCCKEKETNPEELIYNTPLKASFVTYERHYLGSGSNNEFKFEDIATDSVLHGGEFNCTTPLVDSVVWEIGAKKYRTLKFSLKFDVDDRNTPIPIKLIVFRKNKYNTNDTKISDTITKNLVVNAGVNDGSVPGTKFRGYYEDTPNKIDTIDYGPHYDSSQPIYRWGRYFVRNLAPNDGGWWLNPEGRGGYTQSIINSTTQPIRYTKCYAKYKGKGDYLVLKWDYYESIDSANKNYTVVKKLSRTFRGNKIK